MRANLSQAKKDIEESKTKSAAQQLEALNEKKKLEAKLSVQAQIADDLKDSLDALKEQEAKEVAAAKEKQRLADLEIKRLEGELEQYKLDLQAAESEADFTSTQLEKALKSNSQNEKQKNSISAQHRSANKELEQLRKAHDDISNQLEFEKEKRNQLIAKDKDLLESERKKF